MIISVGAHALMFVVSVLFSVMLSGDTDTTFVIGLLFCVILCSLIRLAPLRCWIALAMMFCMVCLFVSQWIALMPIVGFDLGLRVQSLGRSFQMLVCVPPLVCGIVAGQHSPALHDLSAAATSPLVMALWILCALTSLAVLGGWVFALAQRRQRCFQSLADNVSAVRALISPMSNPPGRRTCSMRGSPNAHASHARSTTMWDICSLVRSC
ncbi:hypothetical protein [Bifidobacterium animalis]|uniref:Signal transduction histidine kinase n=1 Tax=Bifidobacterium animalis subsp. lactis TaxID=302911 RepID=A0A8B3RGL5_BIFAN|nr:hypothetical protein [Bifidobacterium animalis]RYM94433.1 signal transduction histidine kinase [Bifidobacterium animalis subsp. lactis]